MIRANQWVEHFPYQDGVLISLWDSSYSDKDVGTHPGHGEILAIDVQQSLVLRPPTSRRRLNARLHLELK